jgi:hypothetical protein
MTCGHGYKSAPNSVPRQRKPDLSATDTISNPELDIARHPRPNGISTILGHAAAPCQSWDTPFKISLFPTNQLAHSIAVGHSQTHPKVPTDKLDVVLDELSPMMGGHVGDMCTSSD